MDSEAFAALMRHLGFAAAACYRANGTALVQVLGTDTVAAWPAAVSFRFDYTPSEDGWLPLGWASATRAGDSGKLWPKGTILYFPEQELETERVVFAVINATGKRTRLGELHGVLEAVAGRVRGWWRDQADRIDLSETALKEHMATLGVDLQALVDHELRTPLSSVAGYAALLRMVDPNRQAEEWRTYWGIVEQEMTNVVAAIDKLSLALHQNQGHTGEAPRPFNAAAEVATLCGSAQERAAELVGGDAATRSDVRFHNPTDQGCIHSRSGRVDVQVYRSDRLLVIDIEDDGIGVSAGSEELIFLRFYQEPGTLHLRKGKRGLGLGLFLARQIVERHLGRLTLLRQRQGTLFRFVWPVQDAVEQSKDVSQAWRRGA